MGIIEGAVRDEYRVSPQAQIFVADSLTDLTDAISQGVDGNGDVILLTRGSMEVSAQIDMDVSGMRLIAVDDGLNPLARGEFSGLFADASYTDGPVMKVTAPVSMEGMGFVSRDTGALFFSGAALLIGGGGDANPFGVWLKNCRFPKWGLDNRIGLAIEGSSDCLIDECIFEGVGSAFDSGIYVQGATQNLVVRNSYFRDCTFAITHGAFAGGGPHCMYHGNKCEDSKLLEAGGNNATGFIFDNWLETATNATSYDDTVTNLKTLGLNFAGNHYSE